MADYFEERGVNPNPSVEQEIQTDRTNTLRLLADFNLFSLIGTDNQLPPPAAQAAIDELAEEKITETGGQCLICLKEYEVDELTKTMPCKHKFHSSCLLPWLAKTNSCPLCRHELRTNNAIYEAYKQEELRNKQRQEELNNLHNSMFT